MAETARITDHQAIRDWAAARTARPAITDVPTGTGEKMEAVSFVFGQRGIHEDGDDDATDNRRMVEWDEWLAVFDREQLVLLVPDPDVIEDSYQLLKR